MAVTHEIMSYPVTKRKHLKSLASLRGIAALMIVFYHLSELLKVPIPGVLEFISSKFWIGVPLFYTLSGFVIAYGYAERVGSANQCLKFYIARFFRIAPLFYTMLAILTLRAWMTNGEIIDFQTMILNVTFLFGLVPGKHESAVWAGWSIGIEMLFYILFPLFAATIKTIRGVVTAFIIACCLSVWVRWQMGQAFGSYGYMNLLTHLPFFMAGIGGHRIWQLNAYSQNRTGWLLFGSAMLFTLILVFNIIPALPSLFGLIYFNLLAVILGALILSACLVTVTPLEHPILRRCGELSFSLYLVHPVLMVILIKLRLVGWLLAMVANEWLVFAFASLVTISLLWGVSNITYRFVEVPGIALGRRLTSSKKIKG